MTLTDSYDFADLVDLVERPLVEAFEFDLTMPLGMHIDEALGSMAGCSCWVCGLCLPEGVMEGWTRGGREEVGDDDDDDNEQMIRAGVKMKG